MLNKFASLALVIALISASAFAKSPFDTDAKSQPATPPSEVGGTTKNEAKPNGKLKADMLKLLSDTKEGKVKPVARPQIQPAKSNSLSKGAKIGIGVVIAVVVIVTVVAVSNRGPGRVL